MARPDRPARKTKSSTSSGSREEGTVRIIGGHLRGRLLPFPVDPRTRPMKDRVREAVFNLVGPTVVGSYAIDLFAGTGVLGIEAVSRGAASATLIERHFPTARAIVDKFGRMWRREDTAEAALLNCEFVKMTLMTDEELLKAERNRVMKSRSAGAKRIDMKSSFSTPMPCSPVTLPPSRMHSPSISWLASITFFICTGSRSSKSNTG